MKNHKLLFLSMTAALLAGCSGNEETSDAATIASIPETMVMDSAPVAANVNMERLINSASEPEQWMTYGGSYNEQRFSQLDQINTQNVDELGLAWFADFNTNRGQQSTPLFVDGVLYVTEAWSKVNAYDAGTGELLWHYDPQVPGDTGGKGCCDVVNRGAAAFDGKIYVGTYDGRLVAIDALTGEEVWDKVIVDQSLNYTSTGAPRVVNGNVIIGNGGSEYNTRGYISSYDGQTGELVWRFYTVPGNPELGFENDAMAMAAETWTGDWWEFGGGGSTWDSITFDPETNLLYFGVGNGSPWNPIVRSPDGGDNLFTVSIVAVDADTGEYVWHFQEIPGDEWDYDAVAQIMVADLDVDGEDRHVLMQAAKNGYYYMLDAYTGQLLRANNFVAVNWTDGYDMETGRPVINEAAQYTQRTTATIIQPGPAGAHGYHPASFSPDTGLLYIPAQESSMAFTSTPDNMSGPFALGLDFFSGDYAYDEPGQTIKRGGSNRLVAWDPIAAEEVWAIEDISTGGILTTAGGLLIKGNGNDQELAIYDAETGNELWVMKTNASVSPGSITYVHNGEQYIAQVVGGSAFGGYYAPTYARLLTFKLGGEATLPTKSEFTQRPFAPPAETASAEVVAAGQVAYSNTCGMCHGDGGSNRGMFPDLRRSPMLHTPAGFDAVVLGGALEARGMISFADSLNADDTAAIRAYLTAQATIALTAPVIPGFGPDAVPEPTADDVDTHSNN